MNRIRGSLCRPNTALRTANSRSRDMKPSTLFHLLAALGLALIALFGSGTCDGVTAQSAVASVGTLPAASEERLVATATPTFVAIPRTFPDVDARAIVVREPGQDVIVLAPGDVTPDALFMALVVLDRMRAAHPVLTHGQMAPISGFSVDHSATGRDRGRLEAVLTRLERQPESDLGTLGRGRLVSYRASRAPR